MRITRHALLAAVLAAALVPAAGPARAQPGFPSTFHTSDGSDKKGSLNDGRPPLLQNVGIDQRLGESLPLDAVFRDETGATVHLGDYFGTRPVLLALVYYECPMLCTQILSGMASTLKAVSFTPGKDMEVVVVSFNPKETPDQAAAKKRTYVKDYGHPETAGGWHFLVGDQASIDTLTAACGFHYAWDPEAKQFAHASVIMVVTPEGKLSRYFYGVEYPPRDVRLGLVEASQRKIGTVVDQVLLFCYHYDPATGKYGAATFAILRAGGVLTLLLLGGFVVIAVRHDHKKGRAAREQDHTT